MISTASKNRREPLQRLQGRRDVAGFTLVELLVVLLILAVLIALLLPAIAGAVRAARNAAVQAEISGLSNSLADFNSKNGFYPPSRLALTESGALFPSSTTALPSGASSDITLGQLYQRTAITFRKLYPKVVMDTSGTAVWSNTSTQYYDFNGNGTYDSSNYMLLQGHESLVFFLGGIPLPTGDGTYSVIGFGKDPSNPFYNGIVGNSMYSNNRNQPLYQFANDRLHATAPGNYPASDPAYGHGIPGYVDSLNSQPTAIPQNFYVYFSTTPNGYDPNDVNLSNDEDSNTLSPLTLNFGTSYGGTVSPTPNPYTTTSSLPNASVHNQTPVYQNAQSFQILSPGADGMYGLGGYYKPNSTLPALPNPGDAGNLNAVTNSQDLGVRNLEQDNLTNFHQGKLD